MLGRPKSPKSPSSCDFPSGTAALLGSAELLEPPSEKTKNSPVSGSNLRFIKLDNFGFVLPSISPLLVILNGCLEGIPSVSGLLPILLAYSSKSLLYFIKCSISTSLLTLFNFLLTSSSS